MRLQQRREQWFQRPAFSESSLTLGWGVVVRGPGVRRGHCPLRVPRTGGETGEGPRGKATVTYTGT